VEFTYDVSSDGLTLVPHEATLDLLAANEVPDAPVLGANTVNEFAANGTVVGTLTATDPDGDPLTFQLLNDAGGRFVLAGNQLLVANGILLDFEQAALHDIEVQVSDGIDVTTQTFTINVTDVNPEIVTGTAAGDTIWGGAGADRIDGAGGDDVLRGGAGADRLNGGAGNDTIQATEGDGAGDRYDGGAGIDTIDFSLTDASATLNLGTRLVGSTDTGTDRIAGFENVIGSQGNDTITGTAGINVLDGQGGNDTINGGGGADTLLGGAGNDTLNGGAGNDIVDGGAGDDTIDVSSGNDTIVVNAGFGNDRVTGFDTNPTNGQDLIDLRALGITDFATQVTITDVGADTLVTIGADGTLRLVGVLNATTITQDDFILS
jgi:Ca2+-binding RTX toxin-like protein